MTSAERWSASVASADALSLGEGPFCDASDSGRLFLARVGVTGLPVAAWAGPGPVSSR